MLKPPPACSKSMSIDDICFPVAVGALRHIRVRDAKERYALALRRQSGVFNGSFRRRADQKCRRRCSPPPKPGEVDAWKLRTTRA